MTLARMKVGGHSFTAVTSSILFDGKRTVPGSAGVYFIALRGCWMNLASERVQVEVDQTPYSIAYIGEGYAVRHRLMCHYKGEYRESGFRITAHADLIANGILPVDSTAIAFNDFLADNSVCGFAQPSYIGDVEKALIADYQPRYNIKGCKNRALASQLKSLRKNFSIPATPAEKLPPTISAHVSI